MKPDIRINPKTSENLPPSQDALPPVQTAASVVPGPIETLWEKDARLHAEDVALDAAYAAAEEFDAKRQERWLDESFEPFTRRTDDPKLAWLEHQLSEAGIMHLRRGESVHAPIMCVEKARLSEAQAILDQVVIHKGMPTRIDDLPDNDSIFYGFDVSGMDPSEFDLDEVRGKFKPFDDLGELEGEGFDPARDGWVNKSTGLP